MYINISCLFLIYVYIYLFQWHFLNISLALDSYLPKDFIDIVEWTLQLAQPVGTRFISSISPPLLARIVSFSISHGCKRHRPDFSRVLAQSSIESRLPDWWAGLAWSSIMANNADSFDNMDWDDEFDATWYKEKNMWK